MIYATIWIVSLFYHDGRGPLWWIVLCAVLAFIVIATTLYTVRQNENPIYSLMVVLGAPSKLYQALVKRTIGVFITGFFAILFAVTATIGFLVIIVGSLMFRFGFNQYGMWTRGISPVGGIIGALVILIIFFLWIAALLLAILPYLGGAMLLDAVLQTYFGVAGLSDSSSGMGLMFGAVIVIFGWIPSSITWMLEQGRENSDGNLVFPRFGFRRGEPRERVVIQPGVRASIVTVLVFLGAAIVTFPMGPFRDVTEWQSARWSA